MLASRASRAPRDVLLDSRRYDRGQPSFALCVRHRRRQ